MRIAMVRRSLVRMGVTDCHIIVQRTNFFSILFYKWIIKRKSITLSEPFLPYLNSHPKQRIQSHAIYPSNKL